MKREFPLYLPFKHDRTYSIRGYIGESNYIDNKGYINKENGKIYICSKLNPPVHTDVPIIFANEDGTYRLKDINAPNIAEIFQEAYLYDLSYKTIVDTTDENEELYDEQALTDINAATSIFVPTINADDDPLKRLIKWTIITKKIDINRLKHKMPQKYGLTNMKSALINKTKMSITNFNIWCELLGITYHVTLEDNGTDRITPLKKPINYSSDVDRITIE